MKEEIASRKTATEAKLSLTTCICSCLLVVLRKVLLQ